MQKTKGKLYLIPTTLGDVPIDQVMPPLITSIINRITHYIAEDARTARRFFKKAGFTGDLESLSFNILNKHTQSIETEVFLDAALKGEDIGLLSEAGVPCVADPGALIVELAHRKNIEVIPLSGPSSIIMALMGSGFNGQSFAFHGYLPIKDHERSQAIQKLETLIWQQHQTQIFIEAPYRNMKMVEALIKNCRLQTKLCIACDITLPSQYIKTKTIQEWKKSTPELHKRPVVFLLYK